MYGRIDGEEAVGADERLGLALEVDLAVLVEVLLVDGDAGVEDRVELCRGRRRRGRASTSSSTCVVGVDLIAVEVGLQVVQLVRVGLLAEDRGAVVVGERRLDRVRRRS